MGARGMKAGEQTGTIVEKSWLPSPKDIHLTPRSGLSSVDAEESSGFCSWYAGFPSVPHLEDGPIRLPTVERHRDVGTGVLGKPDSGSVRNDDAKHTQVEVPGILPDDMETDPVAQVQTLAPTGRTHRRGASSRTRRLRPSSSLPFWRHIRCPDRDDRAQAQHLPR